MHGQAARAAGTGPIGAFRHPGTRPLTRIADGCVVARDFTKSDRLPLEHRSIIMKKLYLDALLRERLLIAARFPSCSVLE
jgi:hypothetical protein